MAPGVSSAVSGSPQRGALRLWMLRFAMLVPLLAIAFAAVPRLVSGFALEAAFPATAYLVINVPMPERTYAATAQILSHAPAVDGETQLLRAEAAALAGEAPGTVAPVAEAGLANAPATARGWIVLAGALRDSAPQRAAAALTLATELAPREYFLIVPRVQAGAPLWAGLPQATRNILLDDARMLATDRAYRPALRALLSVKGGSALVTRALGGDPEKLRALNRSLTRERLGLPDRD